MYICYKKSKIQITSQSRPQQLAWLNRTVPSPRSPSGLTLEQIWLKQQIGYKGGDNDDSDNDDDNGCDNDESGQWIT